MRRENQNLSELPTTRMLHRDTFETPIPEMSPGARLHNTRTPQNFTKVLHGDHLCPVYVSQKIPYILDMPWG